MEKKNSRANGHMTGMQGVYLAAFELAKRDFIVSPTSRSAFGADLLVTDAACAKAWSVQVKANRGRATFWLLNKRSHEIQSNSHIYIFVNLSQKNERQRKLPPDFYIVPSRIVAQHMHQTWTSPAIDLGKIARYKGDWKRFR